MAKRRGMGYIPIVPIGPRRRIGPIRTVIRKVSPSSSTFRDISSVFKSMGLRLTKLTRVR